MKCSDALDLAFVVSMMAKIGLIGSCSNWASCFSSLPNAENTLAEICCRHWGGNQNISVLCRNLAVWVHLRWKWEIQELTEASINRKIEKIGKGDRKCEDQQTKIQFKQWLFLSQILMRFGGISLFVQKKWKLITSTLLDKRSTFEFTSSNASHTSIDKWEKNRKKISQHSPGWTNKLKKKIKKNGRI